MKAISLWQPWASLIANGAKKIETRSWPINYRGPILIHAAKRKNKSEMQEIANLDWFCAAMGTDRRSAIDHLNNLPYGAIVAVADLVHCLPVREIASEDLHTKRSFHGVLYIEQWLGNYEPGRFGWMLENVRPLETPFPYKGEQGLFEVPDSIIFSQIAFSNAIAKELSPL